MKTYRNAWMGLVAGGVLAFALTGFAGSGNTQRPAKRSTGLVEVVEQSAGQFSDPAVAEAAGYGLVNGCVSGPQEGAMGLHFVKGELVGDGQLDSDAARGVDLRTTQQAPGARRSGVPGPRRGLAREERGATGADGAPDELRQQPESLWPARVLRAARLAVEAKSERHVCGLESQGVVRGVRAGRFSGSLGGGAQSRSRVAITV